MRVRTIGNETMIDVADDGPGIPNEARERLFEPFFSTKPQGTGLGLSMVKQIVEAQDGSVLVMHPREGGVTIRLKFPCA